MIVGYGPVGQTAAALLAARGFGVCAIERHPDAFGAPRAVHVDDEIVRLFQSLGIAERFLRDTSTVLDYVWLSARGETLLTVPWQGHGPSGWLADNFFFQPRMEGLLQEAATRDGRVEVLRGWEALEVDGRGAQRREVLARESRSGTTRTVAGSYLLGADGAGSLVRSSLGGQWIDLGFKARWLVADVRPYDPDQVYPMPDTAQVCDPERPTTLLRFIGRSHCRFEFMLHPNESDEEFASDERVWELMSRWGPTPADAELVRHATYEFRSLVADRWSDGRTFLLGDAAHLMPPFLGQGMCSGMRDALNLTWKLDLVQRGIVGEGVLASYEPERRAHVTAVIERAVALGRVVCVVDADEAAERDRLLLGGGPPPPPPPPPRLGEGILLRDGDGGLGHAAGWLSLQATVRSGEHQGRFDDVVGRGWIVLSRRATGLAALSDEQLAWLERLGARLVHVTPAEVEGAVIDIEHRYVRWLGEIGAEALVIRPDFYVFGAVAEADQLPQLIDRLRDQLPAASNPATVPVGGAA